MPLPTNASDTFSARGGVAITPSDATNFAACRAIYVGTGGNVVAVFADNNTAATFVNVPSGAILPVAVWRVNSTNTTASNMVALY